MEPSLQCFHCSTDVDNGLNDTFDMDFTDFDSIILDCSTSQVDTFEQCCVGSTSNVLLGARELEAGVLASEVARSGSGVHGIEGNDGEVLPSKQKKRQKHKAYQRVNVSRKNPSKTALYAFPTFDKCDSLIYLTHSLARHLNTGDFLALYKLLTTHLDASCHIVAHEMTEGLTVRALTKLFRVMDDIHPDRIVCVSDTRVVNNQILSSAHMKFTDAKAIFDSVTKSVKDPMLKGAFKDNRGDHLRRKILLNSRPEHEREQFRDLVASQKDLLVHKRVDFTITFDCVTKIVTQFVLSGEMMSMEMAPYQHV